MSALTTVEACGLISRKVVKSTRLRFLAVGDRRGRNRPPYNAQEQVETAGGTASAAFVDAARNGDEIAAGQLEGS